MRLLTAWPGRPATAELRREIAAVKVDDPLAPVTVIVPNNYVGIATRRALAMGHHGQLSAGRPGLAAVDFMTVYRLAEVLGAPMLAASGRRPVSTPVIAAAVRRALGERPGVFAAVADHPTTEQRLVEAHRELSDLDDHQLDRLAGCSPRARDVVAIHRMVRRLLDRSWYDEQALVDAAIDAVDSGHRLVDTIKTLIAFLPRHLSPSQARLIESVARRQPAAVICSVTGVAEADAGVLATIDRLGLTPPEPPGRFPTPRLEVTSVSDADDEVRHVVRGIVAMAREGVPYDRMAVLHASTRPYARLLHDHLVAAGIPFNGAAVTNLAESSGGRLLRRLLALPDRDYRREDVMGLIAGLPLRWEGRTVPSRAWDQLSREAGVVRGTADWQARLSRLATEYRAEAEWFGDDPDQQWRARRGQRRLELTEALQRFVADLVAQLEHGRATGSWAALARWSGRLLSRYLSDRSDWPSVEVAALDRLEATLERLATLDAVEASADLDVFRRTLELELDAGLGRVGSFGNGVLVGGSWMADGLELDHVWILGLSEGMFPSRVREDSLVPDRERLVTGVLRPRSERTADEHRHLLAALAAVGPDGAAHLLRPRGNLRQSDEMAPSRWLTDLAGLRGPDAPAGAEAATADGASRPATDDLEVAGTRHVPSFAGGIASCTFPATSQEYDLRDLAEHSDRGDDLHRHPLVAPGGPLAAGAAAIAARSSTAFTRFDGNLAASLPQPLTGDVSPSSATALETWADCPFRYLMRHLLSVDPLEAPEQRLRIDPPTRGILVHAILERFVSEALGSGEVGRGGWNDEDRRRLQAIATEEFHAVHARGLTGAELFWRRDQLLIRRALEIFVERDGERRREHGLVPLDTEHAFGIRGRAPAQVGLPDGRVLPLRGSIDLIDEVAGVGDLTVTDYKTGKLTRVTPADPHVRGTKLQLVLYAIAARASLERPEAGVHSQYWHIRPDTIDNPQGYRVTRDIEARTLDAVATIVNGIEQGVFPPHPEETTRTGYVSCPYCDPDGLGTADERRRFVRKARTAELEPYVQLAEPDLIPPPQLPELEAPA